MFLAEPPQTRYDLRFSVAGFPVRVSPFFFLMTLVLVYDASDSYARAYQIPNAGLVVLVWAGVVFASILVHELGHSLAMRRYGIASHIVLYHFGGLAVSTSSARTALHPRRQIFISAAGPGIQLLLAAALILLLAAGRYDLSGFRFGLLRHVVPAGLSSQRALSPALELAAVFLLQVNIYWALLNLAPIYPLDGGNISREIFLWLGVRDGVRYSLVLSLCAAVGLAVWAFGQGDLRFMGVMFAMLAFSNYQLLQSYSSYGGRW